MHNDNAEMFLQILEVFHQNIDLFDSVSIIGQINFY